MTTTPAAAPSAPAAAPSAPVSGGTTTTSPSIPSSASGVGGSPTEPSASPASSGADTSFDWMDSIFTNGGETTTSPPASPTGQTTAPATTPAQTPPAQVPTEPPAVVAASPPAQAQPQVTDPPGTLAAQTAPAAPTPSPQLNPADPHSLAQALSIPENQAAAIEHLAAGALKLSPQDLEALESDPGGTIPKLLARSVVFAQQQFLTQLGNIVPLMIQGQRKVSEAHEQSLAKFYSAWPSLDRGRHHEKVVELGIRYRQMFPNSTLDQMIEHLGPLVQQSVGLPLTAISKGAPAAPLAPTPAAAIKPNGGFVPAAPGSVVQTQQVEADPFGYMGGQS